MARNVNPVEKVRSNMSVRFFPHCLIFVCGSHLFIRYAAHAYTSQTAAHSMFPPDRPHIPCHIVRETAAFYYLIFPSDDLVFSNFIHASAIRTRRGHLLRLPKRLPKSLLQRRLRDGSLSETGRRRSGYPIREKGREVREENQAEGNVQLG